MTIILRRVGQPHWQTLGDAGVCRVGLTVIVGMFPSRAWRVVFLDADQN